MLHIYEATKTIYQKLEIYGYKEYFFIDDDICGGNGFKFTKSITRVILSDFNRGGWLVNFTKSHLSPVQIGKWLGIIIDTRATTFRDPDEKIETLVF